MRYPLVLPPLNILTPACLAIVLPILGALPLTAADEKKPIFEDALAYKSWLGENPDMGSKWELVLGRQPTAAPEDSELPGPYMVMGQTVLSTTLKNPPKGDFTISADVLFKSYSRSLWIGLLPEDGTSGMIAAWDAGQESQHSGQGFIRLRVVDKDMKTEDQAQMSATAFTTALTPANASGHKAVSNSEMGHVAEFITLQLSYKASKGEWNVFVNKNWIAGTQAEIPLEMNRLFIAGGSGALFKNVTVTDKALNP